MKNIKRISMLLLVLMLAASLIFSLAACTQDEPDEGDENNGDGKVSYTVTVKDQYGAAVKGAKVQLYLDGVVPLGSKVETADDGKATISIKPQEGAISANVESLPAGYAAYTGGKVAIKDGAAEIAVSVLPTYTVYVKDGAGNAVAGVAVQLCVHAPDGGVGTCELPKPTDSEGKLESKLAENTYKAKIVSVPDGYAIPEGYIMLEGYSVTIVLQAQ